MLLKIVNNAVKKFLDSDPEIASKLDQFEGKSLLLKFVDIKKSFIVTPSATNIMVSEYLVNKDDDGAQAFTTIVESNIVTYLKLGIGGDYQAMINNGSLKIQGDVEFANQLFAIFKEIDIDWEEVASKFVGDSVAYQLGLFAKRFKSYSSRSVDNFRLDVSEYLQEESRILPTKVEINRFMSDVDDLDANVQRLEARVQRLIEASKQ